MYHRLPTKFDYTSYYASQAAGASPNFPVFRARQRGGFIAPLLKRHGIPFLKWIGKQAASLASGIGNSYLEKGSLSKADMKSLLKDQGKKSAKSALDSIRQQVGAGGRSPMSAFNGRRDARLGAIVPSTTKRRDGVLAPIHGVRASYPSEMTSDASAPSFLQLPQKRRKTTKRRKTSTKGKQSPKRKGPTKRKKKSSKTRKLNKGITALKKTVFRKKRIPKNKISPHTIFS